MVLFIVKGRDAYGERRLATARPIRRSHMRIVSCLYLTGSEAQSSNR
jgi:hypothetical protein